MRDWVRLTEAVVGLVAIAVFVVLRFLAPDGGLFWAGLVLLALAAFLFFWDFERDALFPDDWVEAGQMAACLASALAGLAFLVIHFVG